MATTTQHKQIRIDGMTGDECCRKVTEALENVDGVQVESVEVGTATITADNERSIAAARQAIDSVGFSARQDVVSPKLQEPVDRSGQGRQGYRAQNSNQNAPSGIGRAATQGAEEADGADSNEDPSSTRDVVQRQGQNQGQNQSRGASQRGASAGNTGETGEEGGDQDENSPAAEMDRGAAGAKKKVGDAGRDDRDRGDPMPERVNGRGGPGKGAQGSQRPTDQDGNPTSNAGAKSGGQGGATR
jgi:copper chaperone